MKILNEQGELNVPLFHGTSTLFLEGIRNNGLAGSNPIVKWKVLEFSKDLEFLCQKYLNKNYAYQKGKSAWDKMLEQQSDEFFNFQHGDTYLSADEKLAVKYAVDSMSGSEILSRALKFLDEIRREHRRHDKINENEDIEKLLAKYKYVRKVASLFRETYHPTVFPILIEINKAPKRIISAEDGADSFSILKEMDELFTEDAFYPFEGDNYNFRLINPIKENLTFSMINITSFHQGMPKYILYKLSI